MTNAGRVLEVRGWGNRPADGHSPSRESCPEISIRRSIRMIWILFFCLFPIRFDGVSAMMLFLIQDVLHYRFKIACVKTKAPISLLPSE